jgi:hypothetical protein
VWLLKLGLRLHLRSHLLILAMCKVNFLEPLLLIQQSLLRARLWICLQFQLQLQLQPQLQLQLQPQLKMGLKLGLKL